MKIAEKQKLEKIPSKIDNVEILQLVQSPTMVHRSYFTLLKSLTKEDDKELATWLNVSEKTFRLHKTTSKPIKPQLWEHAIMILSLFKHGIEIFGNPEQFKNWLKTTNFFFDQKAPIAFIHTFSGIKFIDDRLTGMEYGDNA